jgi:hypothetical protein
MVMMPALASMERSERQWEELFEKAGLRVLGYVEEAGDSAMMVAPKDVLMPGQGMGGGAPGIKA